MATQPARKLTGLAVITGASSGIGLELAKLAAADGCALILVAQDDLAEAQSATQTIGAASVETLTTNLATQEGLEALMALIGQRPVSALFANAGTGQGGAFLDQTWGQVAHTIHTNITGTVALIHRIGRNMRARNEGRILVIGSIVGDIPGPFNLAYNSTKSFLNDFCAGLAEEMKASDVTLTCLLPGGTETPFFEKADMEDTVVGRMPKADPAKVAQDGYRAMLAGETMIVSGLVSKVQHLFAGILPPELLAQMHRVMAEPDRHRRGTPPA